MPTEPTRATRITRRLLDRVLWHGTKRTVLRGPAAGLRVATRGASADYAEGTNEGPVQQAMTQLLRPGDTFVDIGANIGFFSLLAARLVGSRGRVVAFEAVPGTAAILLENALDNDMEHIHVRSEAVGAEPGHAPLRVTSHPGGATLSDDADASEITETLDVPVVSLDSLRASGTLPEPDVVKIDVEGHEEAVLAGMDLLLRDRSPVLLVELDAANADALAHKRQLLEARLRDLGYRCEVLAPSYEDTDWEVMHLVARRH